MARVATPVHFDDRMLGIVVNIWMQKLNKIKMHVNYGKQKYVEISCSKHVSLLF